MMTRREAFKSTVLAAATFATAGNAIAQGLVNANYRYPPNPFTLPPLPYAVDALEPHIDAKTMEIHYDRHHKTYVDNLNKAVSVWTDRIRQPAAGLESLLKDLNSVPKEIRTEVRNQGGGHCNHSLFWQMMKKNGGRKPKAELAKAIETSFGNFSDFKTMFTETATKVFGSGWVWLVLSQGKLAIGSLPNQDSPISNGRQPLLGLDVWEHAYYLKYQNKRADYVAAWWNVVNWDFVADRYAKLKG